MSEIASADPLFHHIHRLIAEGRGEEALVGLEKLSVNGPRQKREAAYLHTWCAALQEHWETVAASLQVVAPVGEDLSAFGQTERRRRAYYFLLLGTIAGELGYHEEAIRHYTQCLKCLDERRMNIPSVRLKARCGLGAAAVQTGFYSVALEHYEDALHLSSEESSELPTIYAGLCDVHRRLGNYMDALLYGKEALQIYARQADASLEGQICHLLGRVCFQMRAWSDAAAYYNQALELALKNQHLELILSSFTTLVEIYLEQGLLEKARHAYERALEYQPGLVGAYAQGRLYCAGGKVAEAAARQATGRHAEDLIDEAIACYRKAEGALAPLQAKGELADVYGRQARLLEASGRQNEAIAYWKSAYALYSRPEESLAL